VKPSEVWLIGSPFPLVNTFGSVERECAVAMVVRALAATVDRWEPITGVDIAAVVRADLAESREPWFSICGASSFGARCLRSTRPDNRAEGR